MGRTFTRKMLVPAWVLVLAVTLALAGTWFVLQGQADAQVQLPRHFACYPPQAPNPWKSWYYLPNGADSCPTGHVKIDWVDD